MIYFFWMQAFRTGFYRTENKENQIFLSILSIYSKMTYLFQPFIISPRLISILLRQKKQKFGRRLTHYRQANFILPSPMVQNDDDIQNDAQHCISFIINQYHISGALYMICLLLDYYYIRQPHMQNFDQTNFEDAQSVKIKTPAALFSKSSGKSPINRLRTLPSPSQKSFLEQHCENHQNKVASYFTQIDGQKLHFCQKCAITLASHGHSITRMPQQGTSIQQGTNLFTSPSQSNTSNASNSRFRIAQSNARNPRQAQIGAFLQQLKEMRGAIGSTKQTIKQKLIQSEQFYGQQLQEINDYFSLIIKSLELQKHKCYNHILTQRQNAEKQIRALGSQLADIDQGITKILMDIEDNLETVYSIQEDMYKLVFSQYVTQRQDFEGCLNGLLLEPIEMRKIQFQGVPQSIYSISDVVIQNSIKNQDNRQYRLADSLNGQDFNHIRVVSPDKHRESKLKDFSNAESLKFSFQAQRLRGEDRPFQNWNEGVPQYFQYH